MKNLLLVSLSCIGLVFVAGCADDESHSSTMSHRTTVMESDSKNMTGNTVTTSTTTDVPAQDTSADTSTSTTTTQTDVGYPAIHSNGQGNGF